jgi:hypothetical protein
MHVMDDWYVYIMEHKYIEIYIYRKAQAIRKKQYITVSAMAVMMMTMTNSVVTDTDTDDNVAHAQSSGFPSTRRSDS